MKKLIEMIKRRRSLVLASAFAPMCLGVFVGVGPQDIKHAKPVSLNEIKTVNKTTTLDVTYETTPTNHLVIRLKNLSSKNINGYVVEVNDARITKELSIGDKAVLSGQTDDLELPISASSVTVTILAAMFTDGSIEADPILKAELSEWRLGMKKELVRGLAELDEILASPDVYSTKALDRLGSRLSEPSKSDTGPSPSAKAGKEEASDNLNNAIRSLRERGQRNGNAMQRQRLLDLKARIERRIASL